jgi:hypothetical protein
LPTLPSRRLYRAARSKSGLITGPPNAAADERENGHADTGKEKKGKTKKGRMGSPTRPPGVCGVGCVRRLFHDFEEQDSAKRRTRLL